jgi:ribosomal protein S18 acetylase RimI-like enzyme
MSRWIVRECERRDLDAVGVLAGKLVRLHHSLDPERFLVFDDVEAGYARFLGRELGQPSVVLLVLGSEDRIGGYVYARLEGRDWMRLLDAHGELHDVWVEEDARGTGAAEMLVRECMARLTALGAPRIVLGTAWQNERARRFFAKLGFRPTMVEMSAGG